jgi:hypothetical protein
MEALHEVIEIILLLISIIGAVAAYFRFRGRSFGVSDMLIFVPLAVAADVVCYQLFQAMAGPHGESTAYGALGAMLGLFGLAPVAAGLNMVAAAATLLCMLRHAAVRYGVLALVLVAWAAHLFLGHRGRDVGARRGTQRRPGGRGELGAGVRRGEPGGV